MIPEIEIQLQAIALGTVIGTGARYILLRSDFRIYPSYPHGNVIHLSLGFVAAFLGAVAIPALLEEEYTAVTFLALAAQQFREIRNMERETLTNLESTELVPRGNQYIEGISKVFEARNYLVMAAALLTSTATYLTVSSLIGGIIGVSATLATFRIMRGKKVGDFADIQLGELSFDDSLLFVEDIPMVNYGDSQVQETILNKGFGLIITPKNDNAGATLTNTGQRMAIVHDVASMLGVYKDVNTEEFTPVIRRDLDTGRLAMVIIPLEGNPDYLIEAVKYVPILESALRYPLKSRPGYKAGNDK
ncbi:YIEGIA family protein [Natranaerobius thermophilus]|uniref:YIEGIA protein n=2 Tax=Natranaerobius TaxID=375928 RepID=B2A4N3_NATTJ|nr:YIEGIA family protein [Natranaerobius thermophilus]ACB85208.1 conserved hypothetical protein [Natranaerobius thermophilus JW/NM-WN-LF]